MLSPSYQIKLPQFEGPFDLLLFFIERDELDVHDIPIHRIISEFLQYIRKLEQINIELASEFILFVSTLMRIKARMLLPRRELDEAGEAIDPRQELVDRLLEYKRYKEASEGMAALEEVRQKRHPRTAARADLQTIAETAGEGTEIQTVTAYKLAAAFAKVLKRQAERAARPQHVVVKYNWSQEGQRAYLHGRLSEERRVSFEALFSACEARLHAIFTFLALLDMVQNKAARILIGGGRNNFIVEWSEDDPAAEDEAAKLAPTEEGEDNG